MMISVRRVDNDEELYAFQLADHEIKALTLIGAMKFFLDHDQLNQDDYKLVVNIILRYMNKPYVGIILDWECSSGWYSTNLYNDHGLQSNLNKVLKLMRDEKKAGHETRVIIKSTEADRTYYESLGLAYDKNHVKTKIAREFGIRI